GVGAPKQEKWICKYKSKLPQIKIFMAIGATIDFEAGNINRAPKWVSEVGMEWLYRLLSEPQRLWKRYLVDDPLFFWLILKQKLKLYKFSATKVNPSLQQLTER
ncbi:MAG: WecB/TagA/CpsF family glycosyltransferase, partial [Symploca sp. SIO1C4]|nr:WecB/TagA/CpsF family glycosyltransferase [Symploca sp. SIO1C4]